MDMPPAMGAAVLTAHGGPEVLEVRDDVPVPEPSDGQVLVRVTAAAVNNTDLWTREGAYGAPGDPEAVAGWRGVPTSVPRIQAVMSPASSLHAATVSTTPDAVFRGTGGVVSGRWRSSGRRRVSVVRAVGLVVGDRSVGTSVAGGTLHVPQWDTLEQSDGDV